MLTQDESFLNFLNEFFFKHHHISNRPLPSLAPTFQGSSATSSAALSAAAGHVAANGGAPATYIPLDAAFHYFPAAAMSTIHQPAVAGGPGAQNFTVIPDRSY